MSGKGHGKSRARTGRSSDSTCMGFLTQRAYQLGDCQTYVKTLHQMHINPPSLILVPDTFLAVSDTIATSSGKKPSTTSVLVECIQDEFPDVPVDPVLRKFWNDAAGRSSELYSHSESNL